MRKHHVLLYSLLLWVGLLGYQSCSNEQGETAVSQTAATSEINAVYVGDQECSSCHPGMVESWKTSHHFSSMLHAADSTVLGDFEDVHITLNGIENHLFKEDGKFFLSTQGINGKRDTYQILYTFGVEPLQQYLIETIPGQLQATRIAWDTEKELWFHLNPDLNIDAKEWLHWTRGAMTWNKMCSECHSTNLNKGFDADSETYQTTWSIVNVSCESCHGPGSEHIRFFEQAATVKELKRTLQSFMYKADSLSINQQCAPCHSRRTTFDGQFSAGEDYSDHFRISLISDGLYHPDGQIDDEVFVFGSFLQSQMHQNGVNCTNCHDPHSLNLKFEGNDLCLQCHESSYDDPSHHFHPVETASASCISCHMDGKLYMVNDYRRDHSFRIPRPDQSAEYGVPNACISCHADQTDEWAAEAIVDWYGPDRKPHFSDALLAGWAGETDAREKLIQLMEDALEPSIARATALYYLTGMTGPEFVPKVVTLLQDPDPMMRLAAVDYISALDSETIRNYLLPVTSDSVRAVRIYAAQALAGIQESAVPAQYLAAYRNSYREFQQYLSYNADFKSGQLSIGNHHQKTGRPEQAVMAYEKALKMDSLYNNARLNLAPAYNQLGRNEEAVNTYEAIINLEPDYGRAYYYLGLLHAEMGNLEESERWLEQAVQKDPENIRTYYNLALIYQNNGEAEAAEQMFLEGLKLQPGNPEFYHAITILYLQNNRFAEAEPYLKQLVEWFPENRQYQLWIQQYSP